jgi:hypothetical protein
MNWHFDHVVNYTCGKMQMAFIVVRIPGTPGAPNSMWNGPRHPFPFDQTSSEVEAIVRTIFSVSEDYELNEPCWWSNSIVENERDEWSREAERAGQMHKKLFGHYSTLSNTHSKLLKDYVTLQRYADAQRANVDRMERDSQLTAKAFEYINKSMECVICLLTFDGEKAAVISTCGHVLHKACYNLQKPTMGATCPLCKSEKQSWNKFTGYTGIATALKQLQRDRDA